MAGAYQLFVTLNGNAVSTVPTLVVNPAATSGLQFAASNTFAFTAGVATNVVVQAVDNFYNVATTTTDSFTLSYSVAATQLYAAFSSPAYAMANSSAANGTYAYNLTVGLATTAGLQLTATLASGANAGATATQSYLTVAPNALAPANSTALFGDGATTSFVAGSSIAVSVAALDGWGNPGPSDVASASAAAYPLGAAQTGVLDAYGYYSVVSVPLTSTGTTAVLAYVTRLSTGATSVVALYNVTVTAAAPDMTQTVVAAAGPFTAGVASAFTYTLYDSWGNLVAYSDVGSASASVTTYAPDATTSSPVTATGTLTVNSTTFQHRIAFTPTQSGRAALQATFTLKGGKYKVSLTSSGGTYFTFAIAAGAISTSASLAFGAGIDPLAPSGVAAGVALPIYVRLMDANSNPITTALADSTVLTVKLLSSLSGTAYAGATSTSFVWDPVNMIYSTTYTLPLPASSSVVSTLYVSVLYSGSSIVLSSAGSGSSRQLYVFYSPGAVSASKCYMVNVRVRLLPAPNNVARSLFLGGYIG